MRQFSAKKFALHAFVYWFGTYAYLYFYSITGLIPLYSYFAFLLVVLFAILVNPREPIVLGRGPKELILWAISFIFATCVQFLLSKQSAGAIQVLITSVEVGAILMGFVVLISKTKNLMELQKIFAVIAFVGVVVCVYDFFSPTFSTVSGRGAGLYENPNIAGKYIAFCMVASVPALPRSVRIWFVALCGIGVLVTFSRNSWLLWGIGLILMSWTGAIGVTRYRKVGALAITFLGLSIMAVLYTGALGELMSGTPVAEYLDTNTRSRLGLSSERFSNDSANERLLLARGALIAGAEAPLFGNGLGYTSETGVWSYRGRPHNMFLLYWAEGGIVGLLIYFWFLLILWRHGVGVGKVIATMTIVVSLFTHNQLDQPAALMFSAFVVVHGYLLRRGESKRSRPSQTVSSS